MDFQLFKYQQGIDNHDFGSLDAITNNFFKKEIYRKIILIAPIFRDAF